MAYSVSQDFTNKLYSGSSQFKATLIIGEEEIPNSQISSISISSPIVDTSSDYFYVGSFISQKITIKFKNLDDYEFYSGEEVSLSISQYVNNQWIEVPIGKYLIDDLAENYHKTCEITCMDYAIKFKPNIDYSPCFVNNRATIGTILQYICTQFGVELGVYPLTNDDVVVATYNNTVSGKQWISYIAELKGCNAKIDRTGKLTFKPLTTTAATTINAKKGSSLELGELYKISKVTFTDAIRNFTYGTDTNNTLYIRQDNPFINDTSVVENIYDVVKDFEIYNINTKNFGDFTLDAWDIIEYQVGENTYKTINDNTITYAMSIMGEVNVSIPTKQQEVTTNVIEPNLKTVSTTVDNVNKSVNIAIAEIGDRTGKTTSVTQDIEHIEGLISEVVDVTTSGETQIATLTFEETINASQPIEVKIQPITEDISYLYPRNNLYPKSNLYPKERKLIFTNVDEYQETEDEFYLSYKNYYSYNNYTYTLLVAGTDYNIGDTIIGTIYENQHFDWKLPTDLWIYSNEIYDELYLAYRDGDNRSVTVTRRCELNTDGTVSPLDEPTTETYPYPDEISLTEGHYTATLLGYSTGYLYVRLMVKNIYTSQYATRVEMNTLVDQTSRSIMTEVQETYATQTQANSLSTRIKQTAKNVAITATDNNTSCGLNIKLYNEDGTKIDEKEANITMSGLVKFTDLSNTGSTTINGSNITTGHIDCDLLNGGTINGQAITGGTISGTTITGGTISGTTLNGTSINGGNVQVYTAGMDYAIRVNSQVAPNRGMYIGGTQSVAFDDDNNRTYLLLHATGSATFKGNVYAANISSDKRKKKNIKDTDIKGLDAINKIELKQFDWKESNKHQSIGFIAQDMENINPDYVLINENSESKDYYINELPILATCVKAIQEQQKEINKLKERIEELGK